MLNNQRRLQVADYFLDTIPRRECAGPVHILFNIAAMSSGRDPVCLPTM